MIVRKRVRVEEPESENKFERGTLSTSIRIRRVLVLFFFFVIFAEYEIFLDKNVV